ncbi:MAG: glycerophosphodiester phosphodiesterase family protein [Nitritalea sp.]
MKYLIVFLSAMLLQMTSFGQRPYDLQGHRGARGLMPENTIPAMIKALDLGASTLEIDLAVTQDGELIVSHEPWMNPAICLDPLGARIPNEDRSHNIYQMTLEEVKSYDCGSLQAPGFEQQVNFHVSKPRMLDLIAAAEAYVTAMGLPAPNYNIEIKSMPEGDGIYHPAPDAFSELVIAALEGVLPKSRYNIQSFDFRVLQYLHQAHPDVNLAMLITQPNNHEQYMEQLGFTPAIYSPFYRGLKKETVQALQAKGMQVIPWTVNTTEEMEALLQLGVDGIITDYPNRAPERL